MSNTAKKIAAWKHNEAGSFSTRSFAHGYRSYMPKRAQKAKRNVRRLADVKEARLAWKEVY
jgi:hypothetical protein